jgi:hypothetical protein
MCLAQLNGNKNGPGCAHSPGHFVFESRTLSNQERIFSLFLARFLAAEAAFSVYVIVLTARSGLRQEQAPLWYSFRSIENAASGGFRLGEVQR